MVALVPQSLASPAVWAAAQLQQTAPPLPQCAMSFATHEVELAQHPAQSLAVSQRQPEPPQRSPASHSARPVLVLHSHWPDVVLHWSPVSGQAAQSFPPLPQWAASRVVVRQLSPSQQPFGQLVLSHWQVAEVPVPTHRCPTAHGPPPLPHTHVPVPLHRLTRSP